MDCIAAPMGCRNDLQHALEDPDLMDQVLHGDESRMPRISGLPLHTAQTWHVYCVTSYPGFVQGFWKALTRTVAIWLSSVQVIILSTTGVLD